jgi:hypothetical protein
MEVLISLGILSVGLASVVALIPAGGSQAKLSVIEDRRAALGYAAMADAISSGILNPARWSAIPAAPYTIAIDPLGQNLAGTPRFPATITLVDLAGIVAGSADAEAVFRSADDLVYDTSQSEDDPAIPKYFPGTSRRLSEGNFSWLATLLPEPSGGSTQYYRLSIVCFYKRAIPPDVSATAFAAAPAPPAPPASSTSFTCDCNLSDDEYRSLFSRGTAVLLAAAGQPPLWRHVIMASPTRTGGNITAVELMFDRPLPSTWGPTWATNLHAFPGAIGVTEKVVTLEGSSPWSQ